MALTSAFDWKLQFQFHFLFLHSIYHINVSYHFSASRILLLIFNWNFSVSDRAVIQVEPLSRQGHVPERQQHIVWIRLHYDVRVSCQVTPCPGAGLFPMRPPVLGVSPAPRASQDQRWLPEVQPRTSHHIYEAASLVLLTILCLPHQQHTDSPLLRSL